MLPLYISNSTLPQWVSAGSSLGIFAASLRFIIKWRGQSLSSEEQIRDHYAKEVQTLRDRLDARDEHFATMENHLRAMFEDEATKHEECRKDRDALRERMVKVEDELVGVKRQISQYSADKLVLLEANGGTKPSDVAPKATASAHRVKRTPRFSRKGRK